MSLAGWYCDGVIVEYEFVPWSEFVDLAIRSREPPNISNRTIPIRASLVRDGAIEGLNGCEK